MYRSKPTPIILSEHKVEPLETPMTHSKNQQVGRRVNLLIYLKLKLLPCLTRQPKHRLKKHLYEGSLRIHWLNGKRRRYPSVVLQKLNPAQPCTQVTDTQTVKQESPNREQTTVAKVPTPAINPRAQKVPRDVPQVKPVEAPIRAVAENRPNVEPKTTATAASQHG